MSVCFIFILFFRVVVRLLVVFFCSVFSDVSVVEWDVAVAAL